MAERDVAGLLAINDPLLAPLILAVGEGEHRAALEEILVREARPLVRRILSRPRAAERVLSPAEIEDIESTVVLRLLRRLVEIPYEAGAAIARLEDFTATLAFNAVYDHMRRRFPEWTRLKNRVRHAATHDGRFVMRTVAADVVCRLRTWPESDRVARAVTPLTPPRRMLDRDRIGDAMEGLLLATGAAVPVDDLARALAELWNVVDVTPREALSPAADPAVAHDVRLESRQYVELLWSEIAQLRAEQRAALLLNLRDADGGNAIALFVQLGIATLDTVSAAAGVSVERLAALWSRLPLDDLTIASMLGISRQQVINFRKSARERLARRMRKY